MPRTAILAIVTLCWILPAGAPAADWRNIATGRTIPDEGYCDQPYVVVTKTGDWLCTLTTGRGHEGQGGQHVVSTISSDQGKTWSELADIEPADGPAASWVVPLVTPGGRIYVFYTYNGDQVRQFGWTRFDPKTADVSGTGVIRTDFDGVRIHRLRIYDRYLRTAEIGHRW